MSVGVNYMREHIPPNARIHYALLDAGGTSPNVVQPRARVRYRVRAETLSEVLSLDAWVRKVAMGAALMTETEVSVHNIAGVTNLVGNRPLEEAMHANMMRLGPPRWDAEDYEFAERLQSTLNRNDLRAGKPLSEQVRPLEQNAPVSMSSSDIGDVSWVVPHVMAHGATSAIGVPFHTWQFTAQGKSNYAKKGMIHVAKAMAATALDALQRPDLVQAAKAELIAQTGGKPYTCPIPDHVQAPSPSS